MLKRIRMIFILSVLFLSNIHGKEIFNLFSMGSGDIFKLNPVMDGVLLGTGAGLTGTYIVTDKILKLNDNIFDGNLLDKNDVNAFDRTFMKPYSKPLNLLATGFVGLELISPLFFIAADKEEWFTIGTMYIEAFLLSYGIKEIAKILVDRPRPYMYFDGYPQKKVDEGDWCKSFPSGHTTNAFLGAGFTSYVFWKYFPDSPWRFVVAGGTYTIAIATGILRMMSGNHFCTDVLAGAAIGTACGILVPLLHTINAGNAKKSGENSRLSLNISPFDVGVSVKL